MSRTEAGHFGTGIATAEEEAVWSERQVGDFGRRQKIISNEEWFMKDEEGRDEEHYVIADGQERRETGS